MNTKKYLTFLNIVETGSLTKAAGLMGITQSGVTQGIKSLEDEFGIKLLERNRAGVKLTVEGKSLYPLIREVVAANARLEATVYSLQHKDNAVIRVGTFTSVAVNWLPNIIREYQQLTPDVRIEMTDCGYNTPGALLLSGKIDLGFFSLPLTADCVCRPLYTDKLLAVLPVSHPAAALKSCPVSLFATEPVIAMVDQLDRDSRTIFEREGIRPNIKYTTENDYAMLAMIENGLGIAIIPELILKNNTKNVKIMELDPPATRTIGIAYSSDTAVNPSVLRFADFIQSWVEKNN